jgi:ectoine hydroxylase-related dioxygenase (phytanoyl-CoA dioxygenase family)
VATQSKTGEVLSAEQREQYERDGFLVLDDPCAPELIDEVVADVEVLLNDDFDPGPLAERDGMHYGRQQGGEQSGYYWHRVRDAWKQCKSVRDLALAPKVLAVTEELFGRRVLPFQTLNFPVGTQQRPHHDSVHFDSDPPGFMCGVWVALEDMDMDNGPLVYYPGSQKLPRPSWDEIAAKTGRRVDKSDYSDYQEFMNARHHLYEEYGQQLADSGEYEAAYGTIRKGQALLWAPNLFHGGSPQNDMSRTRHSQVTHYYFEGCRQHSPMRDEDDHVFWFYPEWIKDPVATDTPQNIHAAIRESVPAGSTVAISTHGYEGLLDMEGYETMRFPYETEGGPPNPYELREEAVDGLELVRSKGAEYVVFPKSLLGWLQNAVPPLQAHLENNFSRVYSDGGICVIYSLG